MSKQYRIKWTDADEKELKRVVRNFNAKLARIEKKNPENARYLPKFSKTVFDEDMQMEIIEFTDRVSVNQIKELINTRQDLKREINALKRFSRRGAEEFTTINKTDNNIKITKWQKAEISRRTARVNKKRAERLEEIGEFERKQSGKPLGYTNKDFGMGDMLIEELQPIQAFPRTMTYNSLNWKFRSILKESKSDYYSELDEKVRENYIKGLKENYNWNDIKEIVKVIENLDIREFFKTFYEDGGTFEFASPDGLLDLKHEEYEGYVNELYSTWIPNKKKTKKKTKKKK